MERKIERIVRVVIKIGARRNDPVDEAGLDQGDQAAHPQTGRSQGAREREADGAIGFEELVSEDPANLPQSSRVITRKGLVDQVGDRLGPGHFRRCDAMLADALEIAHE